MFQSWDSCLDAGSKVATLRCLPVIFNNVIAGFLMFVGAVALVLIIYSGIKFITSGGDPKQVAAARQMMTYAIIGAVLVLSSFAILYFISFITGTTDCITNPKLIADQGCK